MSVVKVQGNVSGTGAFTIAAPATNTDRTLTLPDVSGTLMTDTPVTYTVATLPTGVLGKQAFVTDALAPTFLSTVVGGGAIKTPVFYNGTSWIVG